MTGKLTHVYRYRPQPGREYYVQELSTGICCLHEDPALALAQFESIWAGRSPYQLIENAPPQPRRREGAPQTDKALEVESIPWAALCRRFHPDVAGDRTFTTHEIMVILGELRAQ